VWVYAVSTEFVDIGKPQCLFVVKTERKSAAALVYYNGVAGSSAGCSVYYEWFLRSVDFG
jgi:hypothetical protein